MKAEHPIINGISLGHALVAKAPLTDPRTSSATHDFEQATEPPVTYIEILRFLWGSLGIVATQSWRDLCDLHNGLSTKFTTDLLSHFFYIPVGRLTPRLVLCGPYERMLVRVIPDSVTRRYEDLKDLDRLPTREIINCASNNYGGFSKLEDDAAVLVEQTITKLPFAAGPLALEEIVRRECAEYMGFESCETAPSGFSSNILAFRTVCNLAQSLGQRCIFLCDRDCHRSMFTGAYSNHSAETHKFNHNDITDLERQLRAYKRSQPDALICVAVEGIYSMEGSTAPIPAIVALKRMYGFKLLVDEAHSFMALGSSGRGSFNHWQDLGYDCPLIEVDIMTCMYSKSMGCTGGMILANRNFATQLTTEGEIVRARGAERLSTAVLIRVLSILRKPLLIAKRMKLVRAKANYAAYILSKAGCRVLSALGSPIICFPVGTVRQVAMFHAEAFKRGVAIVGGVPPATPVWGCRVRMCVFATLSWTDLEVALNVAIDICVKHKVPGVHNLVLDGSTPALKHMEQDEAVTKQSKAVDAALGQLVESYVKPIEQTVLSATYHDSVLKAGTDALKLYGIGPCSARWFYGSFDVFVRLEQRLASLYPSLTRHAGACKAMVCGDAEVTIGSSFAARSGAPRSKSLINLVFVSKSAPRFVYDALKVSKDSAGKRLVVYDSIADVPRLLAEERATSKRTAFLTIYCDVIDTNGTALDLIPLLNALSRLTPAELSGTCLFLDDRNGLGKLGPRKLGYLDHMEQHHGVDFLARDLGKRASSVQVLVAGSWYNAFGHQGGYVTGCAAVVECLTWDARAYFFSTPPMPLQTAMSDMAVQLLSTMID